MYSWDVDLSLKPLASIHRFWADSAPEVCCQLCAGWPQRDHLSFHAIANYEQIRATVSFLMRLLLKKKKKSSNPLCLLTVRLFNSHDCFLWSRSPLCLWQKRSLFYFHCILVDLFFSLLSVINTNSWICADLKYWTMVSVPSVRHYVRPVLLVMSSLESFTRSLCLRNGPSHT